MGLEALQSSGKFMFYSISKIKQKLRKTAKQKLRWYTALGPLKNHTTAP